MQYDYRLSRTSIEALMALLRREKTHGWGLHVEVLITVYWLAHGLSYTVVSRVFDVPKTTVFDIIHRMCAAILSLLRKVVHFPSVAQCAEVGRGFQHLANIAAFSHCVGAIDGCHIRIKAPHGPHAQDYLNRKLFHSVQLQAICDSTGKFLDIFVGYPGSVHDTRVLRNSPVFVSGCYPPPGHFIVGDGGYPCLSAPVTLITPYREPVRGRVEARFNGHHARARSIIEPAFGMMKSRWRGIFLKALEVEHTFAPKVVAVCAVLHNICVTAGDILEPAAEEDPVLQPPPVQEDQGGQHLRDRLAAQVSAPNRRPSPLQEHDYFIL
ncbi:uncharacterized protein LOC131970756 [Centropristis striata]|uniref:uncharacterized protein LOC131970756 n=1 Tax=Centropristis striata TaxID=184440 RepID=UPI0027E1685F|nr:uncharacterized protein LOC131970756 [Centropristis striata]